MNRATFIERVSHLARLIDPGTPSNRFIVGFALLVLLAFGLFRLINGASPIDSAGYGINAALAAFLAWAVGRELDPDYPLSASLAAFLAAAAFGLWGSSNLLILTLALLVVRIVNRTVGIPPNLLDSLLVVALAGWLAFSGEWIIAAVTALAFLLNALLPEPDRPNGLIFAGLMLVVTISTAGPLPVWDISPVMIVIALAFLFAVFTAPRQLIAVGDRGDAPLRWSRVIAGQLLLLVTAFIYGLVTLSALWMALLGVVLVAILRVARPAR